MIPYGKEYDEEGNEIIPDGFVTWDELPAPRPTEFLLDGRAALGRLTVLTAEEGAGKSSMMCYLAALITSGTRCDALGYDGTPGRVGYIYNEDSRAKVLANFLAMGGDKANIGQVARRADDPEVTSGSADANDLDKFKGQGLSLLIVDPISESLPAGTNMGSATEARAALRPFVKFAATEHCAVLLVNHANRQETPSLRNRVGMSAQLRQLARSHMFALRLDDDHFVIGVDKSNEAAVGPALKMKLSIAPTGRINALGKPETAATVSVVEETDKNISQWAEELHNAQSDDVEVKNDATEWLRSRFGDSLWIDGKEASQDARGMFTDRQMQTARKNLGITRDAGTLKYVGRGSFQKVWYGLQAMDDDTFGRYMTETDHGRHADRWLVEA